MSVTAVIDVRDRADRTLPDSNARLQTLIDDVELVIGARFRDAGGLDVLDSAALRMVVAWAVLDILSRPLGGPTSTEVSVDDARIVDRFDPSGRGADVWIRDAWWDLLEPTVRAPSGAFAIPLAYEPGRRR